MSDLAIDKSNSPHMFNAIAPRYDMLNRILSLGQDAAWRRRLKDLLPTHGSLRLLDLACGTADVPILLVKDHPNIVQAIGIDPAVEMLSLGRQKAAAQGLADKIILQTGDAQALPFLEETFDCITIAFGIRNIPDLRLGLLEMYRVLKNGGRVLILEFSIPSHPVMAAGHWLYLQTIVPLVGFLFSGNFKAYRYLSKTIQDFPYGDRFKRILQQFGFVRIQSHPLLGGVATIYAAEK